MAIRWETTPEVAPADNPPTAVVPRPAVVDTSTKPRIVWETPDSRPPIPGDMFGGQDPTGPSPLVSALSGIGDFIKKVPAEVKEAGAQIASDPLGFAKGVGRSAIGAARNMPGTLFPELPSTSMARKARELTGTSPIQTEQEYLPGSPVEKAAAEEFVPVMGGLLGLQAAKAVGAPVRAALGQGKTAAGRVGRETLANVVEGQAAGSPFVVESFGEGRPGEAGQIAAMGGIADALLGPVGAIGKRTIAPVLDPGKVIGEPLEQAGKNVLRSGMKIKDVTAKRVNKNVELGARKLIDNIARHGVQSPTGGFSGISTNAQKRIGELTDQADALLSDAATRHLDPTVPEQFAIPATVDVEGELLRLMDDIQSGKAREVFLNPDKAAKVVSDINDALELRGMSGVQSVAMLPEIKQTMTEGMKLFKRGIAQIETDPVEQRVGEIVYQRLKDQLNDQVPGLKEINGQIHDLIEIRNVADEATKRIGNRNNISLSDWAMLLGGGPALQAMGVPLAGSAAAPAIASALIAKKALSSGRGASGLISAGQALQTPTGRMLASTGLGSGIGAGTGALVAPEGQESEYAKLGAGIGAGAGFLGNKAIRGGGGRSFAEQLADLADESGAVGARPFDQASGATLADGIGAQGGAVGVSGLNDAQWNKISSYMKRKGYDYRGGADAKELMSRPGISEFTDDQKEAIAFATAKPKQRSVSEKQNTQAVRYFGITADPNEAGYILPNGSMLDFSGRRQGNTAPRGRSLDHRDVGGAIDENPGGTQGMQEFMANGNIRIDANSGTIDMVVAPTPYQRKTIDRLVSNKNGAVQIELNRGLGEQRPDGYYTDSDRFYREYPEGSRSTEILRDIDNYYSGKTPVEKSLGQQYHESGSIGAGSGIDLLTRMAAGGGVGGTVGAQVGESPEDRRRNMLLGAGVGMAGSPVITKGMTDILTQAARR